MPVKIIPFRGLIGLLALAVVLAGCTPAGPRALLRGKKYLDAGEYSAAATQFKIATSLLATNAAVWNYYGVALQRTGQPVDAANAYNRAIELDRDLLEARLNLGMLFLEQNQLEPAKTQFTAYTLRRPNDAAGWLNLGTAQLRLGETVPAERSFSAVLALKTSEADAYNGLGLARIQRNRPQEAAQFFAAALQAQPDFAPALLNLATVREQYLRDNKGALECYHKYLELIPRPANWEAVSTVAAALEQSANQPPSEPAPQPKPVVTAASAPVAETRPVTRPTAEPVATRPLQSPRAQSQNPPRLAPVSSAPPRPLPTQVVQVAPEQPIVARPNAVQTAAHPQSPQPLNSVVVEESTPKPGLWQRLFGGSKNDDSSTAPKSVSDGVTPLPGETTEKIATAKPVVIVPPAPVNFPRYQYLSPGKPQPGDRAAASGAFTRARLAEQNQNWPEALTAYRQAAAFDPSWFEAQYNAGVIAQQMGNNTSALESYENALAIQPGSVDTRYNFALTLKSAGYVPDAAAELKKILAARPDEVRAHLALANLCAQYLHDPAQARQHYLKVLELDPRNPRAADIRFWLAANP